MNTKKSQSKISSYFLKKSKTSNNDDDKKNVSSIPGNVAKTDNSEKEKDDEVLIVESCEQHSDEKLESKSNKRKRILSPVKASKPKSILSTNTNENISDPNNQCKNETQANDSDAVKESNMTKKGKIDEILEEDKENHSKNVSYDLFQNDISFNDESIDAFFTNENQWYSEDSLDLSVTRRCKILEIKQYKTGKCIYLENTSSKEKTWCILEFPWCSCSLEEEDIVSIKAVLSNNNEYKWVVNGTAGVLVTNPDNLISGTSVVGSLFCSRKGVLSDMFKGLDCENKVMTVGSLVHELFQSCIKAYKTTNIDKAFVEKMSQELLNQPNTISMLFRSQLSTEEAEEEINKFVPKIVQFVSKFMTKNNSKSTFDSIENIDDILDIEENLWIPNLGLKGKIDVTCQVKLHDMKKSRSPLELKTGRPSFSPEHRGQLILYIMMMQDLGFDVKSGLLLYLRDGSMKEVPPSPNEMRDLIMLRNEVNYFLIHKKLRKYMKDNRGNISDLNKLDLELPDPINHHSACQKCPYLVLCSTYLHKSDLILPNNHGLKIISQEAVAHLSANHIEYFFKWSSLIFLEDSISEYSNSQLWTTSIQDRESKGHSIGNLHIDGKVIMDGHMFVHCFKRDKEISTNLVEDDYIIVSTQSQYNIATGKISSITTNIVLVCIHKDLSLIFNKAIFSIDLYASGTQLSFNLTNLGLLLDDTDQSAKLRKLIIDQSPPSFNDKISKSVTECAIKTLKHLNTLQQRAVLKALTAEDYLLIQGMPGTGKTQTVVALIKLMVSLNKSVLITSHTHSAVDNVLVKLHNEGTDFLRLGSTKRIHPTILHKSEEHLTSKCFKVEDIKHLYDSAKVVGVTCMGSVHPLLSLKKFDLCIVDESTQVLQCSILRPLFSANKFILIGDPEQLPPVVKSKDAKKLGFDKSLFEQLNNNDTTVILNIQYRMNSVITEMANRFTYNGLLKCADNNISNRTIVINETAANEYKNEKWLYDVISGELKDSVKFIDTGETYSKCIQKYQDLEMNIESGTDFHYNENLEKCSNICESSLIMCILNALLKVCKQ